MEKPCTCSGAEAARKETALVEWLAAHGKHITFAESCTGGLAAARLVGVPAASNVFDVSVVTYANEAKMRYLGVTEAAIRDHGVVSEEVAAEMARGVATENDAQIAVGISGIAGPTGGTPEKPVGTVCFGFYIDGTVTASTVHFGDVGRNAVRLAAVEYVYDRLLALLQVETDS